MSEKYFLSFLKKFISRFFFFIYFTQNSLKVGGTFQIYFPSKSLSETTGQMQ